VSESNLKEANGGNGEGWRWIAPMFSAKTERLTEGNEGNEEAEEKITLVKDGCEMSESGRRSTGSSEGKQGAAGCGHTTSASNGCGCVPAMFTGCLSVHVL
jgi:hypothetical protein